MGITSTVATGITWILYGAIALVVLGAIGYGYWKAKQLIDQWKRNKAQAMKEQIQREHAQNQSQGGNENGQYFR